VNPTPLKRMALSGEAGYDGTHKLETGLQTVLDARRHGSGPAAASRG